MQPSFVSTEKFVLFFVQFHAGYSIGLRLIGRTEAQADDNRQADDGYDDDGDEHKNDDDDAGDYG